MVCDERTGRQPVGRMDREKEKVTHRGGWYKRYTLLIVLIVSFLIFFI